MLEVIITQIEAGERQNASRLKEKFEQINIDVEVDYSREHGNLRFNCPNALTITQEQEKEFGEVLEKIFFYEKIPIRPSTDKVDYGLADVAPKKSLVFLNYASVRFYLKNLR